MIDCLRLVRVALGCSVVASAVVACGPGGPPPSFSLTSPGSAADAGSLQVTTTEMMGAYTVPIGVAATGLMLREPGMCQGMSNCGHVVVNIDDAACNAPMLAFNVQGGAAMLLANLSLCTQITGPHAVRAEFVHDDGTPYAMPYIATGRILAVLNGAGPYNGLWTGTVSGTYTTTEPMMDTQMITNRTATVAVNTPDRAREDMTLTLQSNADEYWPVEAARNDMTATFRLHDYNTTNNGIAAMFTVTAATATLMPMRVGSAMSYRMTYNLSLTFTTRTIAGATVRGTATYMFTGTPN